MTLLELVVALAIVGLITTLAAPSLRSAPPSGAQLADAIRTGRELATRRAQTLALAVAPDGIWDLSIASELDAPPLAHGRLIIAPSVRVRMQLTAMGACIPSEPLPQTMTPWDAARCAVDGLPAAAR
ncbi:MAG: hypothetical protein ABIT38_13105 [Gemmatimonadaceae bacterium]